MSRKLVAAFSALVAIAYGLVVVPRAAHDDFRSFHAAARLVLSGQSPYLDPQYVYPPPFAWAMTPLALLPVTLASALWYALNLGFLLGIVILCERALGRRLSLARAALLLLVTARVWTSNLEHGQTNLLVTFLLVLAFARSSGIALGSAAVVKVFPGLAGLYFMRERAWSALAMSTVTAIVVLGAPALVVGPHAYGQQMAEWSHRSLVPYAPGAAVAPGVMNQSAPAALARVGAPPWLVTVFPWAVLAAACLALFRSPRGKRRFEAFALTLAVMPLVGGLVWKAHYCVLLPAWFLLCDPGAWSGGARRVLIVLSFAAPLATLLTSEALIGRASATAVQLTPLFPMTALLTAGLLAFRLLRSQNDRRDALDNCARSAYQESLVPAAIPARPGRVCTSSP